MIVKIAIFISADECGLSFMLCMARLSLQRLNHGDTYYHLEK
jgi:hypothetical protein